MYVVAVVTTKLRMRQYHCAHCEKALGYISPPDQERIRENWQPVCEPCFMQVCRLRAQNDLDFGNFSVRSLPPEQAFLFGQRFALRLQEFVQLTRR